MITGRTAFHDLPEPLLAFTRGEGAGALTCVFNLGKTPVELVLSGRPALQGPGEARLSGARLTLPGNGYAWLSGVSALAAG